ncbi:MAG: flagellar biosynthetic protein FliR [Pseudomonadota bacterium]
MDLQQFLETQLFAMILVFARIGSALLFMPGFGEQTVPVRYRLALALALSAGLMPATPVSAVTAGVTSLPIMMLITEITIGLWIGLTARILLSALQFAGFQIGLVAGLSNAFAPSQGSFEGSTMIASGMLIAGIALIFATDLHHLIIAALIMTYDIFPVGQVPLGDLAEQVVMAASKSFYIGVAITAPFYVMGLILNLGLGLANRMMPTLPVFFVAVPVFLFCGFLVLAISAAPALSGFLQAFAQWLSTLTF